MAERQQWCDTCGRWTDHNADRPDLCPVEQAKLQAADDPETWLQFSKDVLDKANVLAASLEARGHGTKEEWEAVTAARDASRYLHSAAGWMERYRAKVSR